MIIRKAALPALALAVALSGAGLGATAAFAQATTTPQQNDQQPRHARLSPTQRVEGRIAALKADLKITSQQEPQFDKVAQAMRDNASAFEQAAQQFRGSRDQQKSAVDRLQARTQFASLRAQADQRLLDAFRPLYASLSDQQKQVADGLMSPHHRGHGEHMRRG